MLDLLKLAAEYAASKRNDERTFLLGAVAVRKRDGAIVHSRNSPVFDTIKYERDVPAVYRRFPESHAENKIAHRMGMGSTLYVARVKRSGGYGLAAPCEVCQKILRSYRVEKVYYTITDTEFGIWYPEDKLIV